MKKGNSLCSKLRVLSIPFLLFSFVYFTQGAEKREYVHLVGSSTVFPFTSLVAEQFTQASEFSSPLVERNGTGIGIKLFCSGVGLTYPDIANASRRIKPNELEMCRANGVQKIEEILLGHDGIVLAQADSHGQLQLTLYQLYLALAAQVYYQGELVKNPYQTWDQIDPSLPARPIQVLGPSATSGTYDVLIELAIHQGARNSRQMKQLEKTNKQLFNQLTSNLRTDGVYVEVSENDNMVIQKLRLQPGTIGVIGFSFYEKNCSDLNAIKLSGVAPSLNSLSNYSYPLARPLYVYIKREHYQLVPGLQPFVKELQQAQAGGRNSYLVREGIILEGQQTTGDRCSQ